MLGWIDEHVSRAQKISTVVDSVMTNGKQIVSRAQKISTVVDAVDATLVTKFHALKKFLLL